ncbi:MAG TPA: hypothetical protein DHV36_10205, partial [Desulfobacteraceae bacterium]|nr:hypothetical protein [Desulfobacteraceae bacterium]
RKDISRTGTATGKRPQSQASNQTCARNAGKPSPLKRDVKPAMSAVIPNAVNLRSAGPLKNKLSISFYMSPGDMVPRTLMARMNALKKE